MAHKINHKWMKIRWAAAGFSLVEIMVGMVVGLITIVVIMQSFSAFEAQKRTTTSGSDTLENGLIALQAIESDARSAGYGLLTPNGLACTSLNYYEGNDAGAILAKGVAANGTAARIAPVAISDVGASDSIIFTAATSPLAGMPFKLNSDWIGKSDKDNPDMDNIVGFTLEQDLYLVAAPIASPGIGATPIPCTRLGYASAIGPASPASYYETSVDDFPAGGYPMNKGFVINIGSASGASDASGISPAGFVRNQYRVRFTSPNQYDLVVENVSHFPQTVLSTSAVALASNIVNVQVQYGVAPANTQPGVSSPSVNCWTDATGSACNSESGNWASPSAADIMRVKAIRIAVVARSPLQEKPSVAGGTCDATPASGVVSWPGGPVIDLTANANWRCHRYRVYQTIIPLRNVIWANI